MPHRPIDAVLYDFDGTLADTTELVMECYRRTMEQHLGEIPPDEEWLRGFGTPLEVQIARFARSTRECDAMVATYRKHQEAAAESLMRPFAGAQATVASLRERGLPTAIVTSRHRLSVLRALAICGLADHFPVVVSPEDVSSPKPDPEPVHVALRALGVRAQRAVFIGDSPHDIAAGNAAGTATGAALWGPFSRHALEAENPTHLLERQADVLRIVDGGLT